MFGIGDAKLFDGVADVIFYGGEFYSQDKGNFLIGFT